MSLLASWVFEAKKQWPPKFHIKFRNTRTPPSLIEEIFLKKIPTFFWCFPNCYSPKSTCGRYLECIFLDYGRGLFLCGATPGRGAFLWGVICRWWTDISVRNCTLAGAIADLDKDNSTMLRTDWHTICERAGTSSCKLSFKTRSSIILSQ